MIIACLSCSQMSIIKGNRYYEASCDEGASRSESEPDSVSLHKSGSGQPSLNGETYYWRCKQQAYATVGLPGMIEDGAYRKIYQEPGIADKAPMERRHHVGKHNHRDGFVRESDKPIVVMRSRNGDRAKGLCCECATVETGGEPLV